MKKQSWIIIISIILVIVANIAGYHDNPILEAVYFMLAAPIAIAAILALFCWPFILIWILLK